MVVLEVKVDGLENVFAHFGAGEELGVADAKSRPSWTEPEAR